MIDDEKQYLTIPDVSDLLGLAPATIRAYAARGQMPAPNDCPCCGLGPVWARLVIDEWVEQRTQRRTRGSTAQS